MSAVDDIEMRLIASGYVVGEWTATEIAQVIAPEVEALRATLRRVRNIQQRYVSVSREEMSQTDALGLIGLALDGGESDE